jgi:hypothetical protein
VCVSSFGSSDFFTAGYAFNLRRNKFAKHEKKRLKIYLPESKEYEKNYSGQKVMVI